MKEAAERISVSAHTLAQQAKIGALAAQRVGKQWVVTPEALAAYDEQRKQPRGFARPDHPLHGKRGGGGRPKKSD